MSHAGCGGDIRAPTVPACREIVAILVVELPVVCNDRYRRNCGVSAVAVHRRGGELFFFLGSSTQVQGWGPCRQGHGFHNLVQVSVVMEKHFVRCIRVRTTTTTRLRQVLQPLSFCEV